MNNSSEQREIFRYSNGQKTVCADPAVLYRRFLKAVGGEQSLQDIDQQALSDDMELAGAAGEKLLGAIRDAFNLKPLDEDGNGATEPEQLKAYTDFLEYLSESKKKVDSTPTWQPPTGEQSLPLDTVATSPTPTTSASGSIAAGSSSNRRP